MPALRTKTNFNGKSMPPNGLYIHSSPPRVLQMGAAHIKQAVRSGDVDKLEQIVLEGQGKKLLNEHSSDYRTRMYLKSVPQMLSLKKENQADLDPAIAQAAPLGPLGLSNIYQTYHSGMNTGPIKVLVGVEIVAP